MFDCEVTAIILKRDYEHKMYYTILTNECFGFSKRQRFYLFITIIIICIGVCVHMEVYVEVRGQPTYSLCIFETGSLSLALNSLYRLGWLAKEYQRSSSLPRVGITMCTAMSSFYNDF